MKKLSLKIVKPSFKPQAILGILPYFTIILSVSLFTYFTWYIYQNVVVAANDAVALQSLSEDVVQTRLNTSLYEEVVSAFSKKSDSEAVDLSNLRNPFVGTGSASLPSGQTGSQQPQDPSILE